MAHRGLLCRGSLRGLHQLASAGSIPARCSLWSGDLGKLVALGGFLVTLYKPAPARTAPARTVERPRGT